jgi:NADH dehydrogenase FAD-containing subunit
VLGGAKAEVHQQDVDAVVESERTVGEWDAEWETKKTSRGGAKLGSIFSMGDCASLLGNADGALPQTAQVAAQQGAYVARLLNRGYDLSKPGGPELDKSVFTEDPLRATSLFFRGIASAPGFTFLNLGLLAYVGSSEAVAQVELGVDVRASGRPAFLLWRSVYLVKQVSTRTRFLVLFDWIKSRVFGRDISGM